MKKFLIILFIGYLPSQAQTIRVGAKHFNEGYIISEIISQLLENEGYRVERVYNLGGTLVCFEALRNQAIDVYPEYTGTIASELLKANDKISLTEIRQRLHDQFKIASTGSFGFSNSYGLVMRAVLADTNAITRISDLRDHNELNIGLSYEFLKRADGWENLAAAYGLQSFKPGALEHGLAYEALRNSQVDVTDAYTTDGEIQKHNLRLLTDDLGFFPDYEALVIYSDRLDPKIGKTLKTLEGKISREEIQSMNAVALFDKKHFSEIARDFLIKNGLVTKGTAPVKSSVVSEILSKAITHLWLTLLALAFAIAAAVPVGILLHWNESLAKPMIYLTGLLQTIPSIALLAIMIPLMGIGVYPALVALFLYALLPILRNTVTSLQNVNPLLKEISEGMGMTRIQKLKWIEMPLAMPFILAGIRTASVINIGTATLAAFIGAGGLGEFIVTGLALNSTSLILQGALPAGILAILMELAFEGIARLSIPAHIRLRA